jgi:pantetheine-phosphate adenylyltransferase/8-oxo-dGTP diphosphatase
MGFELKEQLAMHRAVYAASFDPVTNGHLWVLEQGSRLFDELIVAVGINPDKHYTFSEAERIQMLRDTVGDYSNLTVDSFVDQFLVNYARQVKADFILRGIRNQSDFEYEMGMMRINTDLDPSIVTVFLMPPREIAEVSSRMVMGLVGPEGWRDAVSRYVPEPVLRQIIARFGR